MVRLGANDSGISSGLLFALLGSVLLHMVVLLWTPAPSPSRVYTPPPIEARLVQATPLADSATLPPAPRISQPVQTVPRPAPSLAAPQPSSPMAPVATETAAEDQSELHGEPPAMVAQPDAANADGHDPVYYAVEQLDESAHLLGEVQRIYPARARNAGIEGFVTLALLVNERGEVDEVQVMKSQPTGYFEESAIAMLRGQRFVPAIKQGVAVKSHWQTTIRFKLRD